MTYKLELTKEELRVLSGELQWLIDNYESQANIASEPMSGPEAHWRRFADRIKPILEKAKSASHAA